MVDDKERVNAEVMHVATISNISVVRVIVSAKFYRGELVKHASPI